MIHLLTPNQLKQTRDKRKRNTITNKKYINIIHHVYRSSDKAY